MALDTSGQVSALADPTSGRNYLSDAVPAPLLSLRIDGDLVAPVSAETKPAGDSITLEYPDGHAAEISVLVRTSHVRFELTSVEPLDDVELVVWGPYPTTLDKVIGETVGVVQGEQFALGIQALNPKTLGGYPWNENDALPQLDIFEGDNYSDLSPEGKRGVLYRVEAAKPDTFGSTLQAYTRQRIHERIIPNRGYGEYVVLPFDDGGIIGSSIALFGSSPSLVLDSIGKIELSEGLPHPLIDGEWGKKSKSASAAYIILAFGKGDFERALDVTRQAGLRYLYHPDPFESWGHFALKQSYFPRGAEDLRSMVDQAAARGIMLGVHTLSNFITPNDPYVSPDPDSRLALVGATSLSETIDPKVDVIPIDSPRYFNQNQQSFLRASVIDDEIVQCSGVSSETPWALTGCTRGAFDTRATSHEAGARIGKLDDHAYNVFLSSTELSMEIGRNIADLFNNTGLRQISFDGLEGNRSTGMGNYGEILLTQSWFDQLDENIRRHFIADASRTSHFFWHIYTRMNWGEPWYAGFRESQTEYRLKNQAYFQRNLMPGMLGWFSMQPETSVEDIEWMLARSAGFDAGYGFVTGYDRLDANGQSANILRLLGQWEAARMSGAFTSEQKVTMQNIANEFHLETVNDSTWELRQVRPLILTHRSVDRQPGEPGMSSLDFSTVSGDRVAFILSAVGTTIQDLKLEIDGIPVFMEFVSLGQGEHLKFDDGEEAVLYASTWHQRGSVPISKSALDLDPGNHVVRLDADVIGDAESHLKLEMRVIGRPELVAGS